MEQNSSQHTFSVTDLPDVSHQHFKEAYDLYHDKIYTFAYNMVKDMTEAQDITTDTFMKLWRLRENLNGLKNIKAFLYIACKNGCMDYFRRRKIEREAYAAISHLLKIEDSFTNEIIEAEVFAELTSQIERLPKQCRTVFQLIYHNNLKTSEVAQAMGISNQNVLNQKGKAIQILRNALLQKFILPLSIFLLIFLIPG